MNYTMHQKDQCKSTGAKAAQGMLMILTQGVNFTNIFMQLFSTKELCEDLSLLTIY